MTTYPPVFDAAPAPEPIAGGWQSHAQRLIDDPLGVMNHLRSMGDVVPLVRGGNGPLMFPGHGCPGTVFVFGPELNRQVLTQTELFYSGPIIGPVYEAAERDPRFAVLKRVGTGLFALNSTEHQRHRRLIQPAFHKRQVEVYLSVMREVAERTLAEWDDGLQIDLQRALFRHTLTVAGLALFGRDLTSGVDRLGSVIQEWLELIPVVSLAPESAGDPALARFLELSEQIDADVRDLIRWKRSHRGAADVLAQLVQMRDDDGGALTEDELIGHINILLTAGHETTANALSWTIFLLALHPDIMIALRRELERLDGQPVTLEALGRLALLDRVIKESMRLLPPVTIGARYLIAPTVVGGYSIPTGSEVVFSHFHTHHDPILYPDPGRFRPERWLQISPSSYEYLPFSTGPKMCIGAPFALAEIKVTLALLLRRFWFELAPDAVINRAVWVPLRPDHMPVVVRTGSVSAGRVVFSGDVRGIVDLNVDNDYAK